MNELEKKREQIDADLLLYAEGWISTEELKLRLSDAGVVIKVDYYVSGTEVNCPSCHCAFLDKVEPLIGNKKGES